MSFTIMKKLRDYLPFVVLFLLPLLFYPVVDKSGWISSSDVHALLEFASSLLAITAGIMVLLHFFTTGRSFFLVISIGFVLIGTEEFVHAIFSFNRIWFEIHPHYILAILTTWLAGHFILLTSFFIALIFGEREIVAPKRRIYAIVYNSIGFICAAFVALLIFNSSFLPDFVQLGSITKKFIELSLSLLFFAAFIFYFRIYLKQQSRSPLLWSIIACIIFRILSHIFMLDTHTLYDSHWDVAHLLVFMSYFFPIFGVWGETIKLHKSSQVQLIELAKEMTERKLAEEELRASEERLRAIASNTPDHIIVQDNQLRYSFVVNPQLGLTEKDMLGKTDHDFLSKEEADNLSIIKTQLLKTGRPFHIETSLISLTGDPEFFDGTYVPKFDAQGNTDGLIGYFRNITERKQVEEALKIKEALFRELFDNMKSGSTIFTVINDGSKGSDYIIKKINSIGLKMEGKELEEVVGKRFIDIRPTIDSYGLIPVMKKVWETGESASLPTRLYIDEHFSNYYENYIFKLPSGEIVTLYDDVTESKRAEVEIKNIKESLEILNHRLDEIRENERALISREIHDQLGQSLTALKIDLNWLSRQIAKDSKESAKVEGMIDLVTGTIRDVQRISFELRPAILDDLGLGAAVEWYCEEFANRTGLKLQIEIDDVQTESISKNLAIYRVLQESLTNIIRHADAKKVNVKLYKIKKDIVLLIQDNGIGISPDKISSSKSLGLMGMSERVKYLDGHMEITSPGKVGTIVKIYIPIK